MPTAASCQREPECSGQRPRPGLARFLNTKASVALPFTGVSCDPGMRAFPKRKGQGEGVLPASRVSWLSLDCLGWNQGSLKPLPALPLQSRVPLTAEGSPPRTGVSPSCTILPASLLPCPGRRQGSCPSRGRCVQGPSAAAAAAPAQPLAWGWGSGAVGVKEISF